MVKESCGWMVAGVPTQRCSGFREILVISYTTTNSQKRVWRLLEQETEKKGDRFILVKQERKDLFSCAAKPAELLDTTNSARLPLTLVLSIHNITAALSPLALDGTWHTLAAADLSPVVEVVLDWLK
jgi:hypothetical protein